MTAGEAMAHSARRRAFSRAALVLVILAVGLHVGALSYISRATLRRAQSASAIAQQRQQMDAQADRYLNRGMILVFVGLGCAVSSLACLAISFVRHESGPRISAIGLMIVYAILQGIMV
jgi:hypothetical protein